MVEAPSANENGCWVAMLVSQHLKNLVNNYIPGLKEVATAAAGKFTRQFNYDEYNLPDL